MAKAGKRLRKAQEMVDPETQYSVEDAVKVLKEGAKAKFDETIEISLNLGVDTRLGESFGRVFAQPPELADGELLLVLAAALVLVHLHLVDACAVGDVHH